MPESNVKPFDETDFKSEKCKFLNRLKLLVIVIINSFFVRLDVKELVQDCVGGAALQQCKAKIQTYGDQTSSALKKHVYANYMEFIETAKEISRMIHSSTHSPTQYTTKIIF